jgi:hypothetical protein
MNDAAMNTAVTILKGVNIDEPEGRGRSLQDRINPIQAHSVIGLNQFLHKGRQVLWPGSNKLGQRVTCVIPFSEKYPIGPEARMDESCILDQDCVQTQKFIQSQRMPAGLHHRPAPAFKA